MIGATVTKTGRFVNDPKELVRDLQTGTEKALRRAGLIVRQRLREKMTQDAGSDPFWGRRTTLAGLIVRTGGTRQRLSAAGRIFRAGNVMSTAIGSPDEHVRQLEEGGTVGPPPGFQYLRIPTASAQTDRGADRWAGSSIRSIPGAFLRRFKTGRLWALRSKGKNGVELLYLLVRSYTTRGRHMFADTKRETEPAVLREMNGQVSLVVAKANS